MAVVGDDDAVLDRVAADDAAGRDVQAEDRVARRGELVDHLLGRRAAVVEARVGLLQDDHAAALDARVVGVDGGGDEVGETHVGDEAAALVDLQDRLLALFPLGHADLAAEHAGIDADVGQRLGQGEGAAPDLAVLAGLRRAGQAHVMVDCSGVPRSWIGARARLPARVPVAAPPSTQASSKATSARARFLGPSMKPPCSGSMKTAVMPASSNSLEQLGLVLGPFVGVALALGHQRGPPAPRATERVGLHDHLQVVAVGEAPHDLAHVVAGQGAQSLHGVSLRVACSYNRSRNRNRSGHSSRNPNRIF